MHTFLLNYFQIGNNCISHLFACLKYIGKMLVIGGSPTSNSAVIGFYMHLGDSFSYVKKSPPLRNDGLTVEGRWPNVFTTE